MNLKIIQKRAFFLALIFVSAPALASRTSGFVQLVSWGCETHLGTRFTIRNLSSTLAQTVTVTGGIGRAMDTGLASFSCHLTGSTSVLSNPMNIPAGKVLLCAAKGNNIPPAAGANDIIFWSNVVVTEDRGALEGQGWAGGNCTGPNYDRILPVSFNGGRPF